MFVAQDDTQFLLSVEILVKSFLDGKFQRTAPEEETRDVTSSWRGDMSEKELASLRWDTICLIEGVILRLFQNPQTIFQYRNDIVEAAYAIEKALFHRASNAHEYGHRGTLLYKIRCCARFFAERIARGSQDLEHAIPLLQYTHDDKEINRQPKQLGYGARAA